MNFTTKSQVESPRPCRLSHEVAYSFKVCHVSRQVLGVKMVGRLFWVSPCVVAYGIYHKKIEFTKGIVPFVNFRIIWFHLPSLKLKPCTWTWMLGMRVSIWGPAYSQGLAVSFRKWCMSSLMLANFMCKFPCSELTPFLGAWGPMFQALEMHGERTANLKWCKNLGHQQYVSRISASSWLNSPPSWDFAYLMWRTDNPHA